MSKNSEVYIVAKANELFVTELQGQTFNWHDAHLQAQKYANFYGESVYVWNVSSPDENKRYVSKVRPCIIRAGQTFPIYSNRGVREATALAVIEGVVLAEYEMPQGTTALRYVDVDAVAQALFSPEFLAKGIPVSYRRVPKKWLESMIESGTDWIGEAQGSPVPSVADLLFAR